MIAMVEGWWLSTAAVVTFCMRAANLSVDTVSCRQPTPAETLAMIQVRASPGRWQAKTGDIGPAAV